ncbi:hypothetical protein QBC37DRAFT_398195 [Rhypophila decipiens]|uniref:Uncharacterized protein n=1 Tax=Rhypophila decipiens TaxID=261697 RepID=A0AAN7B9Y3_9PEZI|nr:hypothetical protein QBC37DRAFT_398195 [Rhypophila decipiens]
MADLQPTADGFNPGLYCSLFHENCPHLLVCNQVWSDLSERMRPYNAQLPGAVLPGGLAMADLGENTGAGPTPGTSGAAVTIAGNPGTAMVSSLGQQSHAAASNTDLPAATAASQESQSRPAATRKRAARASAGRKQRGDSVSKPSGQKYHHSVKDQKKVEESKSLFKRWEAYRQKCTPGTMMTMDDFRASPLEFQDSFLTKQDGSNSGGAGIALVGAVPMSAAGMPMSMGNLPTTNIGNTSPPFVAGAAGASPATPAGSQSKRRRLDHPSGLSNAFMSSTGLPPAGLNGAGVLPPYASPTTVAGSLGQPRTAALHIPSRPRHSSGFPTGHPSGLSMSNASATIPTAGPNPFYDGYGNYGGYGPQPIYGAPNGTFTGPSPGLLPSPGSLPSPSSRPSPGSLSSSSSLPSSGSLLSSSSRPSPGFLPSPSSLLSPGSRPFPGFLPSSGLQPAAVGTFGTSGTHGTGFAVHSNPAHPSPQVDTAASLDAVVEPPAFPPPQPSEAVGPGAQPAAVDTSSGVGGPQDTGDCDFTSMLGPELYPTESFQLDDDAGLEAASQATEDWNWFLSEPEEP